MNPRAVRKRRRDLVAITARDALQDHFARCGVCGGQIMCQIGKKLWRATITSNSKGGKR